MGSSRSLASWFGALFFAVLAASASSWAGSPSASVRLSSSATSQLQRFLEVDRFHYYLGEWALYQQKQGRPDLAEAVLAWEPEAIARLKLSSQEIGDAEKFDALIEKLLKKELLGHTPPAIRQRPSSEFQWSRGFLKRKLNESYRISNVEITPAESIVPEALPDASPESSGFSLRPTRAAKDSITLNVDSYISSKTTRGVFWDASAGSRNVEFHLGTYGEFLDRIRSRGATIVGEIKTLENNYNPIFLIREAGEPASTYHYAIAQISGADRLGHLVDQLTLARWNGRGPSARGPPNYEVFGNPTDSLQSVQEALELQLKSLPQADKVIIGQKGAVRKTLRNLAFAEASLRAYRISPAAIEKKLSSEELKTLQALAKSGTISDAAVEEGKLWERIYEAAAPILSRKNLPPALNPEVFTISNASHEFSDYLLKTGSGKTIRWRVFSNVWGDEVLPIARALKATGHNQVTYIGTAGALPESGLKVGDLVAASRVQDVNEKLQTLRNTSMTTPQSARKDVTIAQVTTPYEETRAWLAERSKGQAAAVELETGYLGSVYRGRTDEVRALLLISDVVGSKNETLAEADSSRRRRAQREVLQLLLDEDKVIAPVEAARELSGAKGPLQRAIESIKRLAPNRDLVSQVQAALLAVEKRLTSDDELQQLLKEHPGFSAEILEDRLWTAGLFLQSLIEKAEDSGVAPRVNVSGSVSRGTFHPKSDSLTLWLSTSSAEGQREVESAVRELLDTNPKLKQLLEVKVIRGPPKNQDAVPVPTRLLESNSPSECLLTIHREGLLEAAGVASIEGRTGRLRHVQIAPAGARPTNLAFFAPDSKTSELMQALAGKGDPGKALEREMAKMQKYAADNQMTWELKLSKVTSIAGEAGSEASITPELSRDGKSLIIHLQITEKGLQNPAVVLEELMHLQQITRAPVSWGKKPDPFRTFIHPYHWAETVWNAQAGSAPSSAKIARAEVEALRAAQDAVSSYLKSGFLEKQHSGLLEDVMEARLTHAEERLVSANKTARDDLKRRMAQWERTKSVRDALEKQSEKLNDLVAKNDRRGTRKLIEQYIPWDLMEPSEVAAWKGWLDAMEKPDRSKLKLVFRGMYDDTVMKAADGTPFLMSTMLTRNQGNYTRRLRSFATMRDKFGSGPLRDPTTAYTVAAKNPSGISVMMGNHAVEAKGSPFLSVADYDTATHFGPRKLGAFLVDDRRLMPNPLPPQKYLWEQERLVPLILFPDEVVYFKDYWGDPVPGVGPRDPVARKAHFTAQVEKQLGRKLTKVELSGTGDGEGFLKDAFIRMKEFMPKAEKESASQERVVSRAGSEVEKLLKRPPVPREICLEEFAKLAP